MRTLPRSAGSSDSKPREPEPAVSVSEAALQQPPAPRPKAVLSSKESLLADTAFRGAVTLCAVALIAIVGLILFELITQSHLSMSKFGWKFLVHTVWDPVEEN